MPAHDLRRSVGVPAPQGFYDGHMLLQRGGASIGESKNASQDFLQLAANHQHKVVNQEVVGNSCDGEMKLYIQFRKFLRIVERLLHLCEDRVELIEIIAIHAP